MVYDGIEQFQQATVVSPVRHTVLAEILLLQYSEIRT